MTSESKPTPERIFETMNAFQRTEALRAALELDLFTAIGEGSSTRAALARRLGAAEKGVRILCDYLVVIGFLSKLGEEYGLAPDAALFLDRRSPAYLGTASRFLMAPQLAAAFANVAGAVRKGGTTLPGDGSVARENPLWVEFARGMAPMVRPAAQFIGEVVTRNRKGTDGPLRVLDIAAGHGLYGIEIAKRDPRAEVTAVDWSAVLEVAKENAAHEGVGDRLRLLPGSAFDVDFGEGYDVALLTNFFHHFDPDTCVGLMKKVNRSLSPSGMAVTLEFVPNEDRVSPPQPAAFAFIMLNTTPSGDAYPFSQYQEMFRSAGFARSEIAPSPGLPQSVVLAYK
jgi:ubiquinone/menaquinone biosynthesis C-methylase UbiE